MAIATRSAVRSRTRTIIEHLLKLQHSPAVGPRHGWRRTVRVQRSELRDDLTPTLRRQLEDDLAELYRDGPGERAQTICRATASQQRPTPCRATAPTAWSQILSDWLPEPPKARPAAGAAGAR